MTRGNIKLWIFYGNKAIKTSKNLDYPYFFPILIIREQIPQSNLFLPRVLLVIVLRDVLHILAGGAARKSSMRMATCTILHF